MNGNINALTRKNNNICCVCEFVYVCLFTRIYFLHRQYFSLFTFSLLFRFVFFQHSSFIISDGVSFTRCKFPFSLSSCLLFFFQILTLQFYVSRQLQFVVYQVTCSTIKKTGHKQNEYSKQQ